MRSGLGRISGGHCDGVNQVPEDEHVKYFIAESGTQKGPFTAEELAGQGVRPDTMVWAEGMTEWQRVDQVSGLQGVLGSIPAPMAPAVPAPMSPPPPPSAYAAAPAVPPAPQYGQQQPLVGYAQQPAAPESKKLAAGICGILLGGFGVHKFILGMTTPAVIMLCCSLGGYLLGLVTCGGTFIISLAFHVIGIIEGIIYLTKSDADFHQIYEVQKKQWF